MKFKTSASSHFLFNTSVPNYKSSNTLIMWKKTLTKTNQEIQGRAN